MSEDYVIEGASASKWAPTEPPPSLAADRRKLRQALARNADYVEPSKADAVRRPVSTGGVYSAETSARRPISVTSSAASAGTAYTVDGASGRRRAGGESSLKERAVPVHDTESLGAQVLTLKKELAASRAENKLLRVSKERMEAELRRAEHEGEQALRSGGLVDGMGPAAARPEVRLLKSLKARTRELQEELQSKEAQIGELSGQAKGIRVKELEVQA